MTMTSEELRKMVAAATGPEPVDYAGMFAKAKAINVLSDLAPTLALEVADLRDELAKRDAELARLRLAATEGLEALLRALAQETKT